MKELDADKVKRAYARLLSIKNNLPNHGSISPKYIGEYHEPLDHLEELGYNLEEFRIPENQIVESTILAVSGKRATSKMFQGYLDDDSSSEAGRENGRSVKERGVDRAFFMIKLDAVLNYLGLLLQEEPRKPGFQK